MSTISTFSIDFRAQSGWNIEHREVLLRMWPIEMKLNTQSNEFDGAKGETVWRPKAKVFKTAAYFFTHHNFCYSEYPFCMLNGSNASNDVPLRLSKSCSLNCFENIKREDKKLTVSKQSRWCLEDKRAACLDWKELQKHYHSNILRDVKNPVFV